MDFLKNHYEKVVLSVVLLGVAIYAILLVDRVSQEKQTILDMRKAIEHGEAKVVTPVDWSASTAILKKAQAPDPLELSGAHNTFNPVRWLKFKDGNIKKAASIEELLRDFVVTRVSPLYFSVVFEGASGPAEAIRYRFIITDEGAASTGGRRPVIRTISAKPGEKAFIDSRNQLVLHEIQGPVGSPAQVTIEFTADKERISVAPGKDKAYRRVVGYEAEAKFDPEKAVFKGLRLASPLIVAGDPYKVIAITETGITIEAPNQQRYTKPLIAAP